MVVEGTAGGGIRGRGGSWEGRERVVCQEEPTSLLTPSPTTSVLCQVPRELPQPRPKPEKLSVCAVQSKGDMPKLLEAFKKSSFYLSRLMISKVSCQGLN